MANVWMMSFDWDGLSAVLARPAAELAGRLARRRRRGEVPYSTQSSALPLAESDLVTFLQRLLAAKDWYAGKAPREARAIDGFVDYLFNHEGPLEPLQLRPLSDGVMFEILEIAKGHREVDDGRNTPRARDLYLRKAESPPETDVSELADLGSRPFRHPAWDRQVAEELLRLNNPFTHGADAAYMPDYSVHSPEQVLILGQELIRVTDRVRRELDRVRAKRVRDGATANFEEDLVGAIEKAAGSRRAVYARWDY
jgi:hypothetical protein